MGNSIYKSISLLIILLAFTFYGWSQTGFYNLTNHFTNENGLPQNSITGITKDSKGFIWLATFMGLVRYDGQNFKTYNIKEIEPNSSNRISNLGLYKNQVYCTSEGMIDNTDFGTDHWIAIKGNDNIPVVEKKALFYYNNCFVAKEDLPQHIQPLITDQLNPNHFFFNSALKEGYYSYGFEKDFYYFNATEHYAIPLLHNAYDFRNRFFLNGAFYILYTINNNGVLDNKGLIGYHKGKAISNINGSFITLLNSLSVEERQYAYFLWRDDQVLFFIDNRVFVITSPQAGTLDATLICNNTQQSGVEKNNVRFLYLPENNLLLLGTSTNGVYAYKKATFKSLNYVLPQKSQKLKSGYAYQNSTYALQTFFDTALFTINGPIFKHGNFTLNEIINNNYRSLPKTASNKIVIDPENFKKNASLFSTKSFIAWPQKSLEFGFGFALKADTLYTSRYVFKETASALTIIDSFPQLVTKVNAFCLLLHQDSLWMGRENGLIVVNRYTKQFRSIPELNNSYVRHLYKDKLGNIWIGTYSNGWYKYTPAGTVIKMPIDPKTFLISVHGMIEDNNGYLWVSTNNGLFRFLTADLDRITAATDPLFYNYFSKESGFNTNEFNGGCQPSVVQLKDGSIAFPSINGLVVFQPNDIPVEKVNNPIFIESIIVDGKSFTDSTSITLPPNFNSISILVSLPYFGNNYNLNIDYQLSGGNSNWTKLNSNGLILLNRLQPGSYTLTIRYLGDFGENKYHYKNFSFTIKPHWYQSVIFYIAIAILLIVLTFLVARRRSLVIRKRNIQLEKEVKKRTEELIQSKETLKANVKFRSQITSLVLHDIRSPLYYLNKITQRVYQHSEKNVEPEMREQLKDLHLSVTEISDYAQNLFIWLNNQEDNLNSSKTEVVLYELLQELVTKYQLLAKEQDTQIHFNVDKNLTWFAHKDLIHIVIRNLIDNAIKYTKGGNIHIMAVVEKDTLHITVKDNGKGISKEKVDQLLNIKNKWSIDTINNGMGFVLIHDLLEKMKGSMHIESEEGKGTTIVVTFAGKL